MIAITIIAAILGLFQYLSRIYIHTARLKKYNESFILIFILFVLIILMGGSSNNPDTGVYKNMYTMSFYSKNVGFGYLLQILKSFGISLNVIRLSISVIGILLINSVVKKYISPHYQLVFYLFYFIYPYFMDIVQMRNFLSMAIMIYAFDKLVSQTRKSIFVYVILVLIASSFQTLFLIYLPFVLIYKIDSKNGLKFILTIFTVFSLILIGNKTIISSLSSVLSSFFSNITDLGYYLSKTTRFGGYIAWLNTFLNLFVLWYSIQIQSKCTTDPNEREYRFSKLVYWFNVYTVIFLPLVLITLDFYRIQRNLEILNYVVFIISFNKMCNNQYTGKDKQFFSFLILLILIYSFYLTFIRDGGLSTIIQPIFQYNWIIRT